jgi:phosphate transport system ATP-binding protein
MNDLIPVFRFEGHVHFRGQDIYAKSVDPVAVRRHIGMVFQQPNPFAMSIYKNVAFGLRLNKYKGDYDERSRRPCAAPPSGTRSRTSSSQRALPLGRSAAAPLHRPGHRHRARRPADGRALLRPRPDRDAPHRGADDRAQGELHDRHRDPQPPAGAARGRQDGLHVRGHDPRRPHRLLVELGDTQQLFENPQEERTKEYIRGEFS